MEPINYRLIQSEVRKYPSISESDREDFVQDIVVRLLETKPDFISRPYIHNMIRNMLIDRYRKEIRRPDLVFDNKDYADITPASDYEQDTELAEERNYVLRTRTKREKRG